MVISDISLDCNALTLWFWFPVIWGCAPACLGWAISECRSNWLLYRTVRLVERLNNSDKATVTLRMMAKMVTPRILEVSRIFWLSALNYKCTNSSQPYSRKNGLANTYIVFSSLASLQNTGTAQVFIWSRISLIESSRLQCKHVDFWPGRWHWAWKKCNEPSTPWHWRKVP